MIGRYFSRSLMFDIAGGKDSARVIRITPRTPACKTEAYFGTSGAYKDAICRWTKRLDEDEEPDVV